MAQIVGVRPASGTSKKTGKPYNAVFVSYVEPFATGGYGHEANQQYIDRKVFDEALGDRDISEAVGADCTFVFNKNGFLSAFVID